MAVNPSNIVGAGGSILGGILANGQLDSGLAQSQNLMGQGVQALQQGNQTQRQDFQSYMGAGNTAIGNAQNLLANGVGANMASVSPDFNYNANTDPSTQYRISQANEALKANAVAGGSVGGGLGKALTANSQNMSQEASQSALNNWMNQSNQKFNQQNTNYQNAADAWKTNIAGNENLMGNGLNATSATGNLSAGYNSGINSNYMNQSANALDIAKQKAGATAGAISGATSGIANIFSGGF
jgi:hypothetical protein